MRSHVRVVDEDGDVGYYKPGVYRHFNAAGELLYVGCSINPLARQLAHHWKRWILESVRIEIQWCKSRAQAKRLERKVIAAELPKYNVAHKPKAHP